MLNCVDCVGDTYIDSYLYLKYVKECLKTWLMLKKRFWRKVQFVVNWVIFEALYIFCFSLAKKSQLTQHTSGYVKRRRRLKIEVRVERF